MTTPLTTSLPAVAVRRTELTVDGMTCGHCVGHVQQALAEIPGVTAEVDLASATALVRHPETVTAQQLLDAVEEAGYEAAVRGAGAR